MSDKPSFRSFALPCALLAMTLLSACGGSDSISESTQSATTDATKPTAQAAPDQPKDRSGPDSTSPSPAPKAGKEPAASESEPGEPRTPDPKRGSSEPVRSRHEDTSQAKSDNACPNGVSARVCSEAEKALNQGQKKSTGATAGQCPPAISGATCQAIAEGAKEPPESGEDTPTRCPPALSATQCAELTKAYGEATK